MISKAIPLSLIAENEDYFGESPMRGGKLPGIRSIYAAAGCFLQPDVAFWGEPLTVRTRQPDAYQGNQAGHTESLSHPKFAYLHFVAFCRLSLAAR